MGGTQSLHTNSYDEALALPSEKAVRIALRTQQILAHETGAANTVDPLGGSYFIESLTQTMEEEANKYFQRIEQLGGVIPAIEKGFFQKEIAEAAFRYQREIDRKERIIVGVNDFTEGNEEKPPAHEILKIDFDKAQRHQTQRLEAVAKKRGTDWKKRLEDLREAAAGTENLMPYLIQAVESYATLQEICDVFRDVWGEYRETPVL